MLPNGLQYTRQWMLKILGKELVETVFEFAERINQLNLTSQEYALIFPVIICRQGEINRKMKLCHLTNIFFFPV